MKKRKKIIILSLVAFIVFTACGKAELPDISSQLKVEADDSSDESGSRKKEERNIVVASGKAGKYLVELVLKKGCYEDNKLSAYCDTYEGEFDIRVSEGGQEYSNLALVYDNSKEGLNFPADGKIQFCDYNGDGQMDFAIGQRVSSSAKEYHFFTITKEGTLHQMGPALVADAEYFPLFKMQNGKVRYCQYEQKSGKYLNKAMEISAIEK